MKIRLTILALLGALIFCTCVNENEEEIFAQTEDTTKDDTDTTGNTDSTEIRVTYDLNIKKILDNNCTVCHNPVDLRGGVDLDSYSELKSYVDNGLLLGVINHDPGFSTMPRNSPKLSQDVIDLITNWVNDGAPEN